MKERLRKIVLVVCVIVFVYSAVQLGIIFYDYYMIEKESTELVEEYVEQIEDNNPEHRTIHFDELLKTNKDVIGWLYIPDTKIDEPILKGKDNDTYLYTDIYKKSNKAGSIFIDEINKGDFSDDNTIIYGHNMKNGSRFHDLRYFIENVISKSIHLYIFICLMEQSMYIMFLLHVLLNQQAIYIKKEFSIQNIFNLF